MHRSIERHWRQHRPRMVAALKTKGLLFRAVEYAARRTAEATSSLMQQGVPGPQAFERMREEWAYLPSEADARELPDGGPFQWVAGIARTTRPFSAGNVKSSQPVDSYHQAADLHHSEPPASRAACRGFLHAD
jgi:hypothetical protein